MEELASKFHREQRSGGEHNVIPRIDIPDLLIFLNYMKSVCWVVRRPRARCGMVPPHACREVNNKAWPFYVAQTHEQCFLC